MIKNFLNPEGHQNPISDSRVTAILLKRWILPIGGASLGRVCACSLRSRLVYIQLKATFYHNVLKEKILKIHVKVLLAVLLVHNLLFSRPGHSQGQHYKKSGD